ncbi:MAG TPA: hypothetical protein VEU62_00100 [Bryobacterales bacterium]|nr:hypothetical protein [Bryobacterales bacterium]
MSGIPASPGPPPPSAPPPASTGRLIAIVIAVVLGIGLLTAAGLLMVGLRFASQVHVTQRRDGQDGEESVKVDTPFGRLRVQKQRDVDPKLLGIPLYPGAVVANDDSSARVDLDLDFADKSLRVLAVQMETPDSFDQVVDFYRQEAADFTFTHKSGREAQFLLQHGRSKKVIAITEKNGRTRISLANIGEPEAN